MTVEERLDRIEHITAGLAEERRKDRKEYKMLWRDTHQQIAETQRQLQELTVKTGDAVTRLSDGIDELRKETLAMDRRLTQQIADLGTRVDALVSGIGALLRKQNDGK